MRLWISDGNIISTDACEVVDTKAPGVRAGGLFPGNQFMDDYQRFLTEKVNIAARRDDSDVSCCDINPLLKPHLAAIVRWMVEGGCRACFAAFGLGKTIIQLEAVRIKRTQAGGRGLIILPLGVRAERASHCRDREGRGNHHALSGDRRLC